MTRSTMTTETHTLKLTIALLPSESEAEHVVFETSARLGIDDACDPVSTADLLLGQLPSAKDLAALIGDAMDDQGLSCNPE